MITLEPQSGIKYYVDTSVLVAGETPTRIEALYGEQTVVQYRLLRAKDELAEQFPTAYEAFRANLLEYQAALWDQVAEETFRPPFIAHAFDTPETDRLQFGVFSWDQFASGVFAPPATQIYGSVELDLVESGIYCQDVADATLCGLSPLLGCSPFFCVVQEKLAELQMLRFRFQGLLATIRRLWLRFRSLSVTIRLLHVNSASPLCKLVRRQRGWFLLHGAHPPRRNSGLRQPAFAKLWGVCGARG
jgi:hypothetical protein